VQKELKAERVYIFDGGDCPILSCAEDDGGLRKEKWVEEVVALGLALSLN
jgi:hypothetical protein